MRMGREYEYQKTPAGSAANNFHTTLPKFTSYKIL
jgi:hypothetical protein